MSTLHQPDQAAIEKWQEAMRNIHLMVQQELRDAQDCKERTYNHGRIAVKFEAGDHVDLFREGVVVDTNAQKPLKLTDKWIGPFSVLRPGPHPDTYELDLSGLFISDIWPVFHVNVLRPHVSATHPLWPHPPAPPPIPIGGHQEWPIVQLK
ncbi:hypothetical protein HDU89_001714, partial [Geranomyces variabilis]